MVLGLICGALTYVQSRSLLLTLLVVVTATVGLPQLTLARLRIRRINKFVSNFPTAIDIIVRGIKSGLPLGDTIRIAATESPEPVKSEFRRIVESLSIGLTLPEGIERMAQRVPIAETNFFSIVIAIQSKAGGNLSEALGNLSRVLRERKKMKAQDHRHVHGSESFGIDYRRGAVSRRRRALRLFPEIRFATVDDESWKNDLSDCDFLDGDRNRNDEKDDLIRLLNRACHA